MKKEIPLKNRITGKGYGDSHTWIEVAMITDKIPSTAPHNRHSIWKCLGCKCQFRHFYREQPNIFEAIKEYSIPDKCHTPFKS